MRLGKAIGLLGLALIMLPAAPGLHAAEVAGSLLVSAGTNNRDSDEVDVLDEKYQITLVQQVTPYLGFNLSYRYQDLQTQPDAGPDFERRISAPGINLFYQRNHISSLFNYEERRIRGTSASDQLDATSFLANLTWKPERGPWVQLQYRDETNFSDVAVFGRDVASRTWDLDVGRDYRDWSAWYGYTRTEIENAVSGLNLDQDQHEVRGSYQLKTWEDRMTFFANGQVRRVNSDTQVPSTEIYDVKKIAKSSQFRVNQMASSILINRGGGVFDVKPLPRLAQISPGFGVVLRDINLDGRTDCYLVHNHFQPSEDIGIMGSGLSLLLRGTGHEETPFEPVWPRESGLEIPGSAKSLSAVDLNGDGLEDFVVGINDEAPEIFVNDTARLSETHPLRIRLQFGSGNPTAIGSRVTVQAGNLASQVFEVSAGGGYLSQSGSDAIFAVPNSAKEEVSVTVRWPDGKTSKQKIKPTASFIKMKRSK